MARAIHRGRAQQHLPFVNVNCAAIPESLLESELFGYVRGAFTGATRTKRGKFAVANRGTIFLDEIGATSGALQAKLLRLPQEREIEPLGQNHGHRPAGAFVLPGQVPFPRPETRRATERWI